MITPDEIYRVLNSVLTPESEWVTGRISGRSSFTLKNQPVSETIKMATGLDITAQFWMSKDSDFNFEFASDPEFKSSRDGLAKNLRDFIFSKKHPIWLLPPTRQDCSTVSCVDLAGKDDEAVKDVLVECFNFFSEIIDDWTSNAFPRLLKRLSDSNFDTKDYFVRRMVKTAMTTAIYANGQKALRTVKNKEFRFVSPEEAEKYISELVDAQRELCAITGLPLMLDCRERDLELSPSLDRIDSDGHYEIGNLQVVCRFVNRWKSDGDDSEFRRLIGLIRKSK